MLRNQTCVYTYLIPSANGCCSVLVLDDGLRGKTRLCSKVLSGYMGREAYIGIAAQKNNSAVYTGCGNMEGGRTSSCLGGDEGAEKREPKERGMEVWALKDALEAAMCTVREGHSGSVGKNSAFQVCSL